MHAPSLDFAVIVFWFFVHYVREVVYSYDMRMCPQSLYGQ